MHEAATMQRVVHVILEALQQSGASRVTRVQLALGRSGHFTEEAAHQYFQIFTRDTPVEGASLAISWLPATFQCIACHHDFKSCLPAEQVTCPECGDSTLEIEHQDICQVSAIDVLSEEEQNRQASESQRSQA